MSTQYCMQTTNTADSYCMSQAPSLVTYRHVLTMGERGMTDDGWMVQGNHQEHALHYTALSTLCIAHLPNTFIVHTYYVHLTCTVHHTYCVQHSKNTVHCTAH